MRGAHPVAPWFGRTTAPWPVVQADISSLGLTQAPRKGYHLGSLLAGRQNRLEIRRFLLAVNYRRLHILKSRALQEALDFEFRETQPQIGVHLARLFEMMAAEI